MGGRRPLTQRVSTLYLPGSPDEGFAPVKMLVKKWGNSAAVRIPASVMAAASIVVDQTVDIREEGGRIVIERIEADPYELEALLDQMRPEAFPEDIDFGPPEGREMW